MTLRRRFTLGLCGLLLCATAALSAMQVGWIDGGLGIRFTAGPWVLAGAAAPGSDARATAAPYGSIYARSNTSSSAVYVKTSDVGGTTWTQIGAGVGDFSSNTSSSVDSEVVLFSGTGGKTGKRATGSGFGKLASGVLSVVSTIVEGDFGFTDITTGNATTSKHGLLPKLDGSTSDCLLGDGSFGSCSGASGGAPTGAHYVTTQAEGALSSEFSLGSLTTGLQLNTVSGSVATPSTYGGTSCSSGQVPTALNASGAATCSNIGVPKTIIKASDESVSTSASLQDDDDFSISVGANEKWIVNGKLFVTGSTTGDIEYAFNAPSGATGWLSGIRLIASTTLTSSDVQTSAIEDLTDTGVRSAGLAGTSTPVMIQVDAVLINGANSGTLKFRWAQNATDSGNATVVQSGSFMTFTRIQ